jgi:polar amino acid transport system substrate-binding protein
VSHRSRTPAKAVWVRAGLVLLAAAVLSGCSSASSSVNTASVTPLNVLPKGAMIVHPKPPELTQPCNATASELPPTVMPSPGQQMPSGSYMAAIQRRGYLTVGVDQNTYLWGYRDPTSTGTLSGFDIDILKQVAQAIFGSSWREHFRTVIVPNQERIPAVNSGIVDILAETMTINCGRKQSIHPQPEKCCVDFSSVYYWAHQRILVPETSSITGKQDLGGKRVCAEAGSTSLQNLVKPGMPRHIQIWAAANNSDCLVLLLQHQVDAVSTDDAILLGLQAQDPNTKLVGNSFSDEPYGLAISKQHPDFTSFVNGVLAQVRANDTWAQIYNTDILPHLPAGSTTPAPPAGCYVGSPCPG